MIIVLIYAILLALKWVIKYCAMPSGVQNIYVYSPYDSNIKWKLSCKLLMAQYHNIKLSRRSLLCLFFILTVVN